jgi:hypothetical protein
MALIGNHDFQSAVRTPEWWRHNVVVAARPSMMVPWGCGGAPLRWRRSMGVLTAGASLRWRRNKGHDGYCGAAAVVGA